MSEEAIEGPDEQPEFPLRQEQFGGFMWYSGGRLNETWQFTVCGESGRGRKQRHREAGQ